MNIIAMRQEKRAGQIKEIKASMKKAENKDFKSIVLAVMSNLNLSRRTAREYVEVAFFEMGLEINYGL